MLGYFPDPYPDELLVSMCARYALHMRYPHRTAAVLDLFGEPLLYPNVDLPFRLGYLVDHLPPDTDITADRLIYQHTLFPYYAPFVEPEHAQRVRAQMVNGPGANIQHGMRMAGTRYPRLRYCPACVSEERQRLGECYWHRLHQLWGVAICPEHGTWLEESSVAALAAEYAFIAAEQADLQVVGRTAQTSSSYVRYLELAHLIAGLLRLNVPPPGPAFLRRQLWTLLEAWAFVSPRGSVCKVELVEAVVRHWSAELLVYLKSPLDPSRPFGMLTGTWLQVLLRKAQISYPSPVHYLLLASVLGCGVDTFLSIAQSRAHPLTTGPWPCLDPVCEHYEQPSFAVRQIKLTHVAATHSLCATYKCACGCTYRQAVPIGEPTKVGAPRIMARSVAWEDTLRRLWADKHYRHSDIANRLQVTETYMRVYAKRLGLPPRRASGPRSRMSDDERDRREHKRTLMYREQLQAVLSSTPRATRTEISQQAPGLYAWLRTHDRDWCEANLPMSKLAPENRQRASTAAAEGTWRQQLVTELDDAHLAETIRATALLLTSQRGRGHRVSRERIFMHLPLDSTLIAMLRKQQIRRSLPLTSAALQDVVESGEQYVMRRVAYVAAAMKDVGAELVRSRLENATGAYKYRNSPAVRQALDDALGG